VNNNRAFPLTLTLSPGEREQPLDMPIKSEDGVAADCRDFTGKLSAFLPLLGERAGVRVDVSIKHIFL
jgi:hypothetical protein